MRRGEKLYISPFKNKADIIFDSSLPYEVSVMKALCPPFTGGSPGGECPSEEIIGVDRCVSVFPAHRSGLVDKSSLLREFIGGGSYHYT